MQFTQQHTRIRAGSPDVILNRQSHAVISAAIIRDGVSADHAQATEIQRAAFGHLHWPSATSPSKWRKLPEGEMMAYLMWRWTFTGEFEIVSIATHPKHQRQGVASALIHDLFNPQRRLFSRSRGNEPGGESRFTNGRASKRQAYGTSIAKIRGTGRWS
jgi:GNAT superfamily N-acetyltransferase